MLYLVNFILMFSVFSIAYGGPTFTPNERSFHLNSELLVKVNISLSHGYIQIKNSASRPGLYLLE